MVALGTSVPEGLLGSRVRDLAREGGLAFTNPSGWEDAYRSRQWFAPLWRGVQDIGLLPTMTSNTRRLRDFGRGAVVDLSNDVPRNVKPTWTARTPSFVRPGQDVDKLREAQVLEGFVPRTESLRRFGAQSPRSIAQRAAMKARLDAAFPDGWLIKSRGGSRSVAGRMITNQTPVEKWRSLRGSPGQWIAQERRNMDTFSAPQQAVESWLAKRTGAVPHGTHEYRVHVLNGRVVPYATTHKGGPIQSALEKWLPWNSSRTRRAEELTQSAVDAMGKGNREKTFYGFDIGFDTAGKPFVIESNPAAADGLSGALLDPHVSDAMGAAIKGQLPNYVKARRGLWAGSAGLGGYAALKPEEDTRPAWQRWMSKQSAGGDFARWLKYNHPPFRARFNKLTMPGGSPVANFSHAVQDGMIFRSGDRDWRTAFPEYAGLRNQVAQIIRDTRPRNFTRRPQLELPLEGGA